MTDTRGSLFDLYVQTRLDDWGRVFALSRDAEILGHKSKDILQVLIDHKGEMPARAQGFKPLTVPLLPMQIEEIVHRIACDRVDIANVLRAYYCADGRHKVERLETARILLRRRISPQIYFRLHDMGFHRVAGVLTMGGFQPGAPKTR